MTRSDLIDTISARFPQLQQKDAGLAVTLILGAITDSLIRGDRSEIRGFGSFSLNYRKPRIGRNPKSGEKVDIPAKWSPHFKPGLELRERVDVKALPVKVGPTKSR
jgi:integration host factor subunit beta